jgi:hypothetical protein
VGDGLRYGFDSPVRQFDLNTVPPGLDADIKHKTYPMGTALEARGDVLVSRICHIAGRPRQLCSIIAASIDTYTLHDMRDYPTSMNMGLGHSGRD